MVARAPRKRMYRTMQGRMVDIEKLRAANETIQAVGNMNVNARGDVLGPGGKVVTPKSEVITKYYEQPKGLVDDTPVRNRQTPAATPKAEPKPTMNVMKVTPKSAEQNPVLKPVTPKVQQKPIEKAKAKSTEKKGIDAALDGLE